MRNIVIRGAREHNLKNIDLDIPRDRFTVISGMSGSGKSSLAFDTIFAEGQRRYVESLSAYARQFLGRLDKPEVDYIEGLSPAISIEQKSAHHNPRSTVGTVTEIYDYLRLLFARVGTPYCPNCGREIREQSVDTIIDSILDTPKGSRILLLAPLVRGQKGEHQQLIEDARKGGFVRLRIDGEIVSLDEDIRPTKNRRHDIDIVVDRLRIDSDVRRRVAESVETALNVGSGKLIVSFLDREGKGEQYFSQISACSDCGISIPELEPKLFSFNSPYGACPECSGLGVSLEFDPDKVIPNRELSFNQGGIAPYNPEARWYRSLFSSLADHFGFSLDSPLGDIEPDILDRLLSGSEETIDFSYTSKDESRQFNYSSGYPGILKELKRRYIESTSDSVKEWLESFMSQKHCLTCDGRRLRPEALAVRIDGKNIFEITALSIEVALVFFKSIDWVDIKHKIAEQILKEIEDRLTFLRNVGLNYLTIERRASSLSGGEAQRIRLATQIGSSLVGVLYILDEPTIGLHQRDCGRLLDTLFHLRDQGNTLIIVEHDEQTLMRADHIIDLGPGAGVHGGHVIAFGTPEQIMESDSSLTGQFLSGKMSIPSRDERRKSGGNALIIRGAEEHNLKNVDIEFPLGLLTVITGVSGSGKSTLLSDLLYPILANRLGRGAHSVGSYRSVEGVELIDKVINIDQSPIGRTPRSNPATYVGLFGAIRSLFASLPESRARGYKPGRFSFNVKGGRCENCNGDGTIKIEMHFLPDVYVTCDVCKGKRYNQETLDIRYRGKNIHDILEMTVEEALPFFTRIPAARRKLDMLTAVGLGYLRLGQSALTLSGGEAQRIKLSLELSKRGTGKTLYLLDEPTTGLHFADVKLLLDVLQLLVDNANTVVLIEHNLDVIKQADHIIDLGPEGGDGGGEIVFTGTPEEISLCRASHTGRYVADALNKTKAK